MPYWLLFLFEIGKYDSVLGCVKVICAVFGDGIKLEMGESEKIKLNKYNN